VYPLPLRPTFLSVDSIDYIAARDDATAAAMPSLLNLDSVTAQRLLEVSAQQKSAEAATAHSFTAAPLIRALVAPFSGVGVGGGDNDDPSDGNADNRGGMHVPSLSQLLSDASRALSECTCAILSLCFASFARTHINSWNEHHSTMVQQAVPATTQTGQI
jgi:hypothetical protein